MESTVKFKSKVGLVLFDFKQEKIVFDRGGLLADTMGLPALIEINMVEITAVEIWEPTFWDLGGFGLIVNNIRYMTKYDIDATQFFIAKSDFPLLKSTLQRVLVIAKIKDFKRKNTTLAKKEIYNPKEKGLIFSFTTNSDSTLKVYNDYLIIKHAGLLNTLALGGVKGEKRIPFSSISSIECKKATSISTGFLQFSVMGSGVRGGAISASGDENSILFGVSHNQIVQQIVDYIEKRRMELNQPVQPVIQNISSADELVKFKQLLDQGIITQEEFDAKKKQLLGL